MWNGNGQGWREVEMEVKNEGRTRLGWMEGGAEEGRGWREVERDVEGGRDWRWD